MIYLLLLICTNTSGHNSNITIETYMYKKYGTCLKNKEKNMNNVISKCEKYSITCDEKKINDK